MLMNDSRWSAAVVSLAALACSSSNGGTPVDGGTEADGRARRTARAPLCRRGTTVAAAWVRGATPGASWPPRLYERRGGDDGRCRRGDGRRRGDGAGPRNVRRRMSDFPADNAWNVDVSSPSIATTAIYTGIPQGTHLHPDLGGWSSSGRAVRDPVQRGPFRSARRFDHVQPVRGRERPGTRGMDDQSERRRATASTAYPIPNGAKIEGESDP